LRLHVHTNTIGQNIGVVKGRVAFAPEIMYDSEAGKLNSGGKFHPE